MNTPSDTIINRIVAGHLVVAVQDGRVRVVWHAAAPFTPEEVAAWGAFRPGLLLTADDPRNFAFIAAMRR